MFLKAFDICIYLVKLNIYDSAGPFSSCCSSMSEKRRILPHIRSEGQKTVYISCRETNFRKPAVLHLPNCLLLIRLGKEKALWRKVDFLRLVHILCTALCTAQPPPDAPSDCGQQLFSTSSSRLLSFPSE